MDRGIWWNTATGRSQYSSINGFQQIIEILTKTPRLDCDLHNSLRSITSENIAAVKASVLVLLKIEMSKDVLVVVDAETSSETQGLLAGTMQYLWAKVYFNSWRAPLGTYSYPTSSRRGRIPSRWLGFFSAQSAMRSSRVTLSPSHTK